MRRIALFFVTVLLLSLVFIPSSALAESDCEEGDGWEFRDGVLTVSANNGLEDFFQKDADSNHPRTYKHYGEDVDRVIIGKNVTTFMMFPFGEDFYPTQMSVEAGNAHFAVKDGWLVDLKTKTLICAMDLDRFSRMPAARNIPASVEKIGADAFYPINRILQVHLPDSIVEIGERGFASCEGLQTIQLPPKLKTIETRAFDSCYALKKVNVGSSVETIGEYAFNSCYDLERINLEDTKITVLNQNVFAFCGLKSVMLPDTLQEINANAFYRCLSLESITICSDKISIRDGAFSECDKLRQIIFTKGVPKSIGSDLFSRRGNVSEGVPDSGGRLINNESASYPTLCYTATYAEEWAPNGETSWNGYPIRELNTSEVAALPKKTDYLANTGNSVPLDEDFEAGNGWIFQNSTLLVMNNNGLDDFTSNALNDQFEYKYNHFPSEVATIVIGKSVSQISPVSSYNYWLYTPNEIRIEPGNPFFTNDNGWIVQIKTGTLVGPASWETLNNTATIDSLPGNIRAIGQSAFDLHYLPYWQDEQKKVKIKQIAFPDSLTDINKDAFNACQELASLVLPPNLAKIGDSAFSSCSSLESIQFGAVRSIETSAFQGCRNLASANLGNTQITELRTLVFADCTSLRTLIFPETLQVIETGAFQACESLETVLFRSDHVAIQSGAFRGCTRLQSMIFTKGVPATFEELFQEEFGPSQNDHSSDPSGSMNLSKTFPYPTLYYTAAYADEWSPNGETEWNGYQIQQISQEELDAILAEARGEEMPTVSVSPVPTDIPQAETPMPDRITKNPAPTPNTEMFLLFAIGTTAIAVVVVSVLRKQRSKK